MRTESKVPISSTSPIGREPHSKRQSSEETEIQVAYMRVFTSMCFRYIFKEDRPWWMSRILWRQEGQYRKGSLAKSSINFNIESWTGKGC